MNVQRNARFMAYGLKAFVLILTLGAVILLTSCGRRSGLDAGPMLQDVTKDGFTVVWWQKSQAEPVLSVRSASGHVLRFPGRRKGSRRDARASGLESSEHYDYWIQTGEQEFGVDTPWHARTAKGGDEPFSFLVFGDSGSGEPRQYELAATMERHEVDIILHVGDLVYGTADWDMYTKAFFQPYVGLLPRAAFYPVLGNHDVDADGGEAFLNVFALPDNGPEPLAVGRCYWFDYGNARIVGLDSNLPENVLRDSVADWVRKTLTDSDAEWRFVLFHHPPYTGEVYPPDVRIQHALVPVLEECGVDIVFCGHAHCYERTLPILKGRPSPGGVTYITTGAGGKSLRPHKLHPPAYMAAFDAHHDSFTVVTVSANMLHLKQISTQNQVLDQVTLIKRGI